MPGNRYPYRDRGAYHYFPPYLIFFKGTKDITEPIDNISSKDDDELSWFVGVGISCLSVKFSWIYVDLELQFLCVRNGVDNGGEMWNREIKTWRRDIQLCCAICNLEPRYTVWGRDMQSGAAIYDLGLRYAIWSRDI